jgi:hypothetical protein
VYVREREREREGEGEGGEGIKQRGETGERECVHMHPDVHKVRIGASSRGCPSNAYIQLTVALQ